MKQTICPHCGEEKNFHFNYDYTQKHMPIINVLCNECGEFFDNKEQQKKILIEIMEADAENGVYDNIPFNPDNIKQKPFNIALIRDIMDYYDLSEISFSRMVEMLNDTAIKWHEQQAISKMETLETWEDIEEEYQKDEYPVFGGPFTNAMTPFEWLKKYYYSPKRK